MIRSSALIQAAYTSAHTPMFRTIRHRAAAADRGETDLAPDLAALHRSGVLSAVVDHTGCGGDTGAGVTLLRCIGRASLSVGRIVEGHANALRLVHLYGTRAQQLACNAIADSGGLFGVWGADGRVPVSIMAADGPRAQLQGSKLFCSGLGLLTRAVVPVKTEAGPILLLVDADDPDRADASTWQVSGMRATASGSYNLTDIWAETLGSPGDYLNEPHFEGGIWRYCALHCGGLEALADLVRQHIQDRGQTEDPAQIRRLAKLVILAQTARLWVDAASHAVETAAVTDTNLPGALAQVLLAREAVEHSCQSGIALVERTIGTAAFASGSEVDRIRRDLGFFLRQANRDGKLAAAAAIVLNQDLPVGEMW